MLFSCQRQFKGYITFSAFPLLCFSIAVYWNLSHMHFVLNQDVSLWTTFDYFAAKSSDLLVKSQFFPPLPQGMTQVFRALFL